MKRVSVFLLFFVGILDVWGQASGEAEKKVLNVWVYDVFARPMDGVSIVLQPENIPLTATDILGKATIAERQWGKDAKLQFTYIGYKQQLVPIERIRKKGMVTLEVKKIDLDEVVVKGVGTKDLLKEAKTKARRSSRKEFVNCYERYYGEAQYMKVTECFDRAVEFRREYGCFLTTGNTKQVGDFSQTLLTYDELEDNRMLQEKFTGGRAPDRDQLLFTGEAMRRMSLAGEDIFARQNREDLVAAFDWMLEQEDVSDSYKHEILKYRTYRGEDVASRYDMLYDLSFIPAYSQRTFCLDGLAEDTLPIRYNMNFDAGSNKLFTMMRCIYLYAPVFSPSSNFIFRPSDTKEHLNHVIDFETNPKKYPRSTLVYGKGRLWISKEDHRLVKIQYDRFYYHLYRLEKMSTDLPPFETSVMANFDYDKEGVCYIKSCKSITYWLNFSDEQKMMVMYPAESSSRVLPGEVELREIEGFEVHSFNELPNEFQNEEIGKMARLAALNPVGEYNPSLFDRLKLFWDCSSSLVEMNLYFPLIKQFRLNSGKRYYNIGGKYFNLQECDKARQKILDLFWEKEAVKQFK